MKKKLDEWLSLYSCIFVKFVVKKILLFFHPKFKTNIPLLFFASLSDLCDFAVNSSFPHTSSLKAKC